MTPALTVGDFWDVGVAVATVEGEIGINTVGDLSERLRHIAVKEPQRQVVDLAWRTSLSIRSGRIRASATYCRRAARRDPLGAAASAGGLQAHGAGFGICLGVIPNEGRCT